MDGLKNSLNHKFLLGTAAGLLISSVIFVALFLNQYHRQLSQAQAETAAQVNSLLQASLENAMLKRDLVGLHTIVKKLGQQPRIADVFITNPKGEIRFSSDPDILGQKQPFVGKLTLQSQPSSHFTQNHRDDEIFRSINPVKNQQQCKECHGTPDVNPVNGILYVDFNAESMRSDARNTTLLLMGSGTLIVIINLIGGWWFFRRFVLKPVNRLSAVSNQLMQGELDARCQLPGKDELHRLGQTLDQMATNLQAKITDLKNQQEFLQALVDAIPDGIRIIDRNHQIRLTNQAYQKQIQQTQSHVGLSCYQSSHALDKPCVPTLTSCPVHELTLNDRPIKSLHQHTRHDGSLLDVEIYAAPMQAVVDGNKQKLIVESIRDLREAIQYSQEQKMSELGTLAAGVAHEIHNPLGSVRLALHALEQNLQHTADENTVEYLSLVDKEIDKCIEVTHRLLKLSSIPSTGSEIIQINHIIDDTVSLLKWEADSLKIQVEIDLHDSLRILATDSEMRMVALNLVQNAFHAMPQGGQLMINSKKLRDTIEIHFIDTGVGIGQDEIKRIFDPFFSHRADTGKGTGLGLSIAKNIVEHFHGSINVHSSKGNGSVFTLTFPDADHTEES